MSRYLVKGSPTVDSPYMWWSTVSLGPVRLFANRDEAWCYLTHRVTDQCATCTRERAQAEVIMHNADMYGSSAANYHDEYNNVFSWSAEEQRISLGAPLPEVDGPLYHWYLPREQVTPYIQALLHGDVTGSHGLLVPRLAPVEEDDLIPLR